jgi:cellulose synthase/poly-beta-1,6-N-acetylglucosamine synthase-like glycosyltransferase
LIPAGSVVTDALVVVDWAMLAYFAAVTAFSVLLIGASALELREHLRRVWEERHWRLLSSEVAPQLSILAPAFNEEATVAASVRALLTLQYPNLEVVLVNDGSSDRTLDVLTSEFELQPIHPVYRRVVPHAPIRGLWRSGLFPGLLVVDKENGGKADALNAGLNVATGELVCAMDADTLIEQDALLRMVRPFLLGDDVVAAGGTIRVANGCAVRAGRVVEARVPRRALPGIQTVEYIRAFLFGRLGWNRLGGNLIISGAFGLFRRAGVLAVGGYLHGTVGEDMELVARLRRNGVEQGGPHRVEFIADPVAWTEVPETLTALGRQRDRWHRGLADVLWRYRGVALRPRYGAFGLVAYPAFVVVELLAPLVQAAALPAVVAGVATGAVDWTFAGLFLLVATGLGVLVTVAALLLDQAAHSPYRRVSDRLLLLLWAALEPFGYRQLVSIWMLRGLWRYLRGRTDWGTMTRRGFATPASETDSPQ